uniref:RING-type domain-containing protein n=1 Tax=Cyanistes caeruleus TaxID=156563 RepID=A0A8C0UH85_CYACU
MARENDSNCLICQDTPKDVASALPCHHRFCLGCILRWTQTNPSCPLCRTLIETVRFSERGEQDYLLFAELSAQLHRSMADMSNFHFHLNTPISNSLWHCLAGSAS